jgi:hypothetical protein
MNNINQNIRLTLDTEDSHYFVNTDIYWKKEWATGPSILPLSHLLQHLTPDHITRLLTNRPFYPARIKLKYDSELLKSTFCGTDGTGNRHTVLIDIRVGLKIARSLIR